MVGQMNTYTKVIKWIWSIKRWKDKTVWTTTIDESKDDSRDDSKDTDREKEKDHKEKDELNEINKYNLSCNCGILLTIYEKQETKIKKFVNY